MTKSNEFTDVFQHINIRSSTECWPWLGPISRKGEPQFTVKGRKYPAYRIVKWLTVGGFNILDERLVPRHCCTDSEGKAIDNPLCCNPAHTVMGTHEENQMDMMLRGRSGLTKEAVSDIIKIHAEMGGTLTHGQIADRIEYKHKVKCARQTVTDILNGRRRLVLQDAIRKENAAIEESGNASNNEATQAEADTQGTVDGIRRD